MIIILNGSIGVGKTSVSWKLNQLLQPSVMLDGDFIGAVSSFQIYDKKRAGYLYRTFAHLIKFHQQNGYKYFIINYVFENNLELNALVETLENLGETIFSFWLACEEKEQRERILKRNNDQVEWELQRIKVLNEILETANKKEFIGEKIKTSGSSVEEVAKIILQKIGI